ncbi:MAG TPA: chromosomal replication initiator protein DnaA [Ktedonobacterales bacterium]
MSSGHVWRAALDRLRGEMTRAQFDTWLRGTDLAHDGEDGVAVLRVGTAFARAQLESRFRERIELAIAQVTGHPCVLRVVVGGVVMGGVADDRPRAVRGTSARIPAAVALETAPNQAPAPRKRDDPPPAFVSASLFAGTPDGVPAGARATPARATMGDASGAPRTGAPTGARLNDRAPGVPANVHVLSTPAATARPGHSSSATTDAALSESSATASASATPPGSPRRLGRGPAASPRRRPGTGGRLVPSTDRVREAVNRRTAQPAAPDPRPLETRLPQTRSTGRLRTVERVSPPAPPGEGGWAGGDADAADNGERQWRGSAGSGSTGSAPDGWLPMARRQRRRHERDEDEKMSESGDTPLYMPAVAGTIPAVPRLNARYTFATFIVGSGNRLAHAASQAVAEAPGQAYNPLFLYGGVGLGKTHLLHAVGHKALECGLKVLYVSSETFTNEIVNAIRYRTTEEFRAKYRSVDVLLVDDIQFIAGKDSTEEEFFHTFNSLYETNKQIVICSDHPPKAIVSLEERLRSRFEWGLIADIQPPDLETRMAILRAKSDQVRREVPDEVITYLASRVQSNIRELEGSFNRLLAFSQLQSLPLTVETAKAALASIASDGRQRRVSVAEVLDAVAEYFRLSADDLRGKQRDKHIVVPRQIAMYLMRQETEASLLEIGQALGGRDHSTVLHGYAKIGRALNEDTALRKEVLAIRQQLLG